MRDVGEMTKSTMDKSHPLVFIVVTVDTSYILGIVNLPTTRTETSALYHGHVVRDTRSMLKTCDMLSFCAACLPMGVWEHCARIMGTQRKAFLMRYFTISSQMQSNNHCRSRTHLIVAWIISSNNKASLFFFFVDLQPYRTYTAQYRNNKWMRVQTYWLASPWINM